MGLAGVAIRQRSAVSRFTDQERGVDADLGQRLLVFLIEIRLEDNLGVGRAMKPAIGLDLAFKLARRPARVTMVAVRLMPPAILSVESFE